MAQIFNWDFAAGNTEISVVAVDPPAEDYYIMRTREPLDGVSPFKVWDSFNHGLQIPVTEVEVTLSGGELLMQMHLDQTEWGLGRLQWDVNPTILGTSPKQYMERKSVRLPASMAPYEDYFGTWYGFNEYRAGRNWLNHLDTQFQMNLFTRAAWDYIVFSPTINHYNLTTQVFENRWNGLTTVRVPIDSEFEMEQLMVNSLGSDGRWLVRVRFAGEKWQTVCDYRGRTAHPDATELEDFDFFNPLKIYTNSGVITYMNANSGTAALACSRITAWQDV